jgi:hypothetical protein
MMGAAYANILSNLGAVIAAYYAAQKYYRITYEIRRLWMLFGVLHCFLMIFLLLKDWFIKG